MSNQDPPIYQAAQQAMPPAGAAGTVVAPPAPVNQQDDLQTQIERIVAQRMGELEGVVASLKKRAEDAEQALRSARFPAGAGNSIPQHGAGPGLENLQTWGQYYQDLAAKGLLTAEHIAQADGRAL
jgi:hypothetical protein